MFRKVRERDDNQERSYTKSSENVENSGQLPID